MTADCDPAGMLTCLLTGALAVAERTLLAWVFDFPSDCEHNRKGQLYNNFVIHEQVNVHAASSLYKVSVAIHLMCKYNSKPMNSG